MEKININIPIDKDLHIRMRKKIVKMAESGQNVTQREFIKLAIENSCKDVK